MGLSRERLGFGRNGVVGWKEQAKIKIQKKDGMRKKKRKVRRCGGGWAGQVRLKVWEWRSGENDRGASAVKCTEEAESVARFRRTPIRFELLDGARLKRFGLPL